MLLVTGAASDDFDFFLDFFSSGFSTSGDSFSVVDFSDKSFISGDDNFGDDFFVAFNPVADFEENSSDDAFGDTSVVSGDDFVSTTIFDFFFDFFADFFGAGFPSSAELFSTTSSFDENDAF